jgi:hypothetical protein
MDCRAHGPVRGFVQSDYSVGLLSKKKGPFFLLELCFIMGLLFSVEQTDILRLKIIVHHYMALNSGARMIGA